MMNSDSFDFLTHLEDEVALEGLDGITLDALWLRLDLRPNFTRILALDEASKAFLWSIIVEDEEISLCCLTSSRPPLKIFNRYDYLDAEVGIILEPEEEFEDIYPFCPLEDEVIGARGSCQTYYTRNDVTVEASLLSFKEAMDKYGEKLVLVANQRLRDRSLGINQTIDKLYDLTLMQYAIIERIGRSRSMGEITQGKNSLANLRINPKSFFYFRKRPLKMNLLTKQCHRQKSIRGHLCTSSLLHLTRFYIERRSKFLVLIERAIEILLESPNLLCTFQEMKDRIGVPFMSSKKLLKNGEFLKYIKTVMVPYRQVFQDAEEAEWKYKNKDEEKLIRCFTLANPNTKPEDVCKSDESGESEVEDEDDQYSGILDQSNIVYGSSLLRQAYQVIEDAGPGGITQVNLARKLGQTKLDSRSICRNLHRRNVIHSLMNDKGKQRLSFYISNKYAQTGYLTKEFHKERLKMISMIEESNQQQNTDTSETLALHSPSTSRVMESDSSSKFEMGIVMVNSNFQSSSKEQNTEASFSSSPQFQMVLEQDPKPHIKTEALASNLEPKIQTSKNCWWDDLNIELSPTRKSYQITTKLIKRAYLIIQTVKTEKVIDDVTKLQKIIIEAEAKEGSDTKMDRKSLIRLLDRLTKSGYLRRLLVRFKNANKTRCIKIVADPSIDLDSPLLKAAIEQNKHKFLASSYAEGKSPIKASTTPKIFKSEADKDNSDFLHNDSVGASMQELKRMHSLPSKPLPEESPAKEDHKGGVLKTGIGPKFVRLQEIHMLLFYMIYGYNGNENLDQEEAWNCLIREHGNSCLASESRQNYPQIYTTVTSWTMFVPPLPIHNTQQRPGWAFVVDILLRLPLCKFVRIINVSSFNDILEPMLNHPLKQNILIKDLEPEMRRRLLQGRRYVLFIMELINRLCYMGLTQYGKQVMKEKDQVFLYLNRNAILVDTTVSGPGYHQITTDKEYVRKQYTFKHMQEITQYWYDLWTICMHTPLGGHACVEGKKITIQILQKKPKIIESTTTRSLTEAPEKDVGYIPGDGRGAGGLDSAMFSHLKRNWSYTTRNVFRISGQAENCPEETKGIIMPAWSEGYSYSRYLRNTTQPNSVDSKAPKRLAGIRNARLSLYKQPKSEEKTVSAAPEVASSSTNQKPEVECSGSNNKTVTVSRRTSFQREIKVRKKGIPKKPYYDEEDKAALRRMKKLRVDWSPAEDSFLILCKVASSFLYPNRRGQMIGFPIVRDLLHLRYPESRNKTSRACQRRINYILKNSTTEDNVAIFLEEVKQDANLCQKFQGKKMATKNKDVTDYHRELFRDLIEALINKFGSSGSRTCPDLPDSLEEFDAKYQLIRAAPSLKVSPKVTQISSLTEIDYYVVYALIYSSLCTKQDRESWAYQLYLAYQKYPQSLLNSVLTALRESQMISYKKSYNRSKYTRTCLPLSASPFQLSCTFIHLFNQKYQYEIFGECWDMAKQLLELKKMEMHHSRESPMDVNETKVLNSSEIPEDFKQSTIDLALDHSTSQIDNQQEEATPDLATNKETLPTIQKKKRRRRTFQNVRKKKRRIPKKFDIPLVPKELLENDTLDVRSEEKAGETNTAIESPSCADLSQENLDTQVIQESQGDSNNIPIIIDQEGGYCAAIVSLMITKRIVFDIIIPDQIIMFDDVSYKTNLQGKSLIQRVKDHETMSGRTFLLPEDLKACSQPDPFVYDEDIYSDELRRSDTALPNTNLVGELDESSDDEEDSKSSEITRKRKHSDDTQVCHDTLRKFAKQENPCSENDDNPLEASAHSSSTSIPSKIRRSNSTSNSRMALYVIREHLSGGALTKKPSNSPDNLIVNACDISCRLRIPPDVNVPKVVSSYKDLSDLYFPLSEEVLQKSLAKRKNVIWTEPTPLDDLMEIMSSSNPNEYLKLIRNVYCFVESTKEIGVSAKTIKKEFSDCCFHPMKALRELEEAFLVCKMGVATLRWVSAYFCKPWMIHTNKIPRAMAKSMEATRVRGVYEVSEGADHNDEEHETIEATKCIPEEKEEFEQEPPHEGVSLRSSGKARLDRASSEETLKPVKPHHLRLPTALINRKYRKDLAVSLQIEDAALKMEQNSEYQEIDVAVRPWVRLNGCLNRRVMDRFIGSILTFIMENPGLTAQRIANKFWPALQPAHTYELIETLTDLKCINRFVLKKSHTVSLFSKPQIILIDEVEDFDFDEEFLHEATIDAIMKFAIFIGDKKYKQDFLATCR